MVGTGDLAAEMLASEGNQSSLLGSDKWGKQPFSPQIWSSNPLTPSSCPIDWWG